MSEGVALKERRKRAARSCRHHWMIETPHGKTSRGLCKNCGNTKRFLNAAEDALWRNRRSGMGRWANRGKAVKPGKIHANKDKPSA